MGNLQALAWAEAVTEGEVPLGLALQAHLTGNFFPPLPAAYVTPVLAALAAVEAGEEDRPIAIDPAINPQPRAVVDTYLPAWTLVEITHTEAFLRGEQ